MRREDGRGGKILIGLASVHVALLLVVPLVYVISQALAQGARTFAAAFADPNALAAIRLTLLACGCAVAFNTVFGVAAAWCTSKFEFRGRQLLMALIDLPLSLSPVVVGLMFLLSFGRSSPLYGTLQAAGLQIMFAPPAVILVTTFVTLPFVFREIAPLMMASGSSEEEAAALMGASLPTIWRRITFPHIRWGLAYGVVLCAARALGEFGAVSVVSGNLRGLTLTLPTYIEALYNEYQYTAAFACAALLVLLALAILLVRVRLEARGRRE